jgi:hypothetical protein
MTDGKLHDKTVKILRITAVSLGTLMIIFALLANLFGLSSGGEGISKNQIGFFLAGAALVAAGFLGRRFPACYRNIAVLLLNILVAIVILEFLAIVLLKLIGPEAYRIHIRKVGRGNLELLEANVVQGMYAPFVVWRSNPALNRDSVTITADGYRITPGMSNDPEAFKVFLLGGSAMWGSNVSDANTIGSFLQRDLTEALDCPVAVYNLAQVAHSSTQEVIELVLQLRAGNIPAAVIFYDGFNDTFGAYEAGKAGGHLSERLIGARVEGRPEAYNVLPPLQSILRSTNTYLLISSLQDRINERTDLVADLETYSTMGIDADSLALEIVSTYIGNLEVVDALANQYGFEYMMVLQPSVWYGAKQFTEYEQKIYNGGFEFFLSGDDPAFKELYTRAYSLFEDVAVDSVHCMSYAGIFDGIEETVYNDYSGVHVKPWANKIIAEILSNDLQSLFPSNSSNDSLITVQE